MQKPLTKRPLVLTITAWVFIIAGATGFAYHFSEINWSSPFANDGVWVEFVRLLAIAGGILTLRGFNSGRWILLMWMIYHVWIGFLNSWSEGVMHLVILAIIAFGLLNKKSNEFLRSRREFNK